MTEEDEVTTLRRRGYRAICLAGCDPLTQTLPRWHRSDDTADTVSLEFLQRAAGLVRAVLDDIDGAPRIADRDDARADLEKELACVPS